MVVSWDGSVTMIGFQGVAMGSPAAAAGSPAGALVSSPCETMREAILVDEEIPIPERPVVRPGRNRNLPMVVSWDGSVTMIGFHGVAMGSPAAAADFLAGALRRRGERRGV